MGKIADVTFNGKSGARYSFNVYSLDTEFESIGAVYAFTKRTVKKDQGSHGLLYIGETEDLSERIPNHEKWPCVSQHDGNCICVHRDNDKDSRLEKETDLIQNYEPPCND